MLRYVEEANGLLAVRLFTRSYCQSLVHRVRGLDGWAGAEVRQPLPEGGYGSVRITDDRSASVLQPPHDAVPCRDFGRMLTSVVTPLIAHVWQLDLSQHAGTQLIRYQAGGYYRGHADADEDVEDRYVSVVCYLNDEFAGGQTWFPSLDYAATPEAGKAIVFPSRYFHCARPVTSGEKYVLVSWMIGPAPIAWL